MDGDGRHLKPGRIEVTDSQLILYQKGNICVKWPLKSLRRYGFDSEVFSFECGRRCSTGPGVYAFKCKRAQALFTILQECINNSGGGGGGGAGGTNTSIPSIEDQVSLAAGGSVHSPPPVPNGTLQNVAGGSCPTVDSSGYLEPINANSHLHYPTGPRTAIAAGSPGGYVCIHSSGNNLDWPAVATSLPNCCSLGACGGRSIGASPSAHHHYTNAEVIEQAAGCSNRVCVVHHYVNSSVVSSEMSHRCCMPPKCCSSEQNENTYINSPMMTLSPGHLPCSSSCCAVNCTNCVDVNTNYAKLDDLLKQEQSAKKHKEQPFYVNVKPDAATAQSSSTSSKCVSGRSTPTEQVLSRSGTLTSPTSPTTKVLSSHCYVNLSSPASVEDSLDKEEDQVNYAVLDLDQNDVVMSPVAVPSNFSRDHSQVNSPVRSPEGYAQIDFDKTVALSNSAIPCPINDDSIRKTRHNAVIPCSSMSA